MARPELSREFVEDSASEQDSDEATPSSKDKVANKQRSAKQSSSEDSSSSSSEDEDETSDSQLGSSGLASSTKDLKRKNAASEKIAPSKKAKSSPAHIPSRSYQPPPGYEPVKPDSHSSVPDISHSSSKQVWHLTVPASVPMTALKSFDLQGALQGKPILEHKGVNYQLHATSSKTDALLLPLANPVSTGRGSEVTVAYETSSKPVTRSFQLRELASISTASENTIRPNSGIASHSQGSQANNVEAPKINFCATQTGSKPKPRQQLKGLMMRYHPFGSQQATKEKMRATEGEDESDDEAMHDAQVNGFEVPAEVSDDDRMDIDTPAKTSSKTKSDKKKKRKDQVNGALDDGVSKPSRKEKKSNKDQSHLLNGKPAFINGDISAELPDRQKEHKERKKGKHRKKDKELGEA